MQWNPSQLLGRIPLLNLLITNPYPPKILKNNFFVLPLYFNNYKYEQRTRE